MDDKQFEARMTKLKNHYDRMPSLVNAEKITANLPNQLPRKRKKRSLWIVSLASACILAILVPLYAIQQQQEMQAMNEIERANMERFALAKKEFETWRQAFAPIYKEEKERQRKALHLTEEQFHSLAYVQNAEASYQFYTSDASMAYYAQGAWQGQLTIFQNETIEKLRSPKLMLLKQQQDDAEEINDVQMYIDKVKALSELYHSIAYTPEIIAAAKDEGFVLMELGEKKQLVFDYTTILDELFTAFSPETIGFFEVIKAEHYFYAGELVVPFKEAAKSALLLERTLLDEQYDRYTQHLAGYYELMMLKILTEESNKELLQFLIAENSAVAPIATTLLEDVSTKEQLDYRTIHNALLAKKYP
ncbi:hypothetical protein [Metasolibacillus meyeri]|uniref:hypothetical protein n=1 Tax=Metasolibacillus meyeri TaxID=1071052 RepID=UPI000D3234FA|nr:hypothetical protein [Metasolibacillus meyeri]